MAVFQYNAVDLDSSSVAGTVVADTPRQARDILRQRGMTVTRVHELIRKSKSSFFANRQGRGANANVAEFVRELATLLTAGIPLLSALHTLVEQHKGKFKAVIQHLADRVAAGAKLADAMEDYPAYFDELCLSIVDVGEQTGALENSLTRLADFKEKSHQLKSKVATALIYPCVVCTVGLGVSIFLMTYVVPNLLNSLMQADKELPAVTRLVKGCSDFLINWWWVLLFGVVGVIAGLQAVIRTQRGRLIFDRIMLRIPVLGDLIRKENTSRMAVVMAALLRSGLEFVKAIHITRRTLRNRVFRRAMDDYELAVTAGSDVSAPLKKSGVFSPMVVQMLAVGQQAGQLEDMLEQLADAYQQQIDTATQRMTALLEPLLIVLLAILIGVVAFATILPILEMSNVL